MYGSLFLENGVHEAGENIHALCTHLHWSFWLLMVWFAGFCVFFSRIVTGNIGLYLLKRDVNIFKDERCADVMDRLMMKMEIHRKIPLLLSERCAIPFTFNVFHPLILLPSIASDWPPARLRAVLAHELAHIENRDCLAQYVLRGICALFWFIPFVWIAYRSILVEQERACDSRVIDTGMGPSEYAGYKVDIVRLAGGQRMCAGSALMAGPWRPC
jgi:beta-lactamase regulating signal transducer with metallopeptidase domain